MNDIWQSCISSHRIRFLRNDSQGVFKLLSSTTKNPDVIQWFLDITPFSIHKVYWTWEGSGSGRPRASPIIHAHQQFETIWTEQPQRLLTGCPAPNTQTLAKWKTSPAVQHQLLDVGSWSHDLQDSNYPVIFRILGFWTAHLVVEIHHPLLNPPNITGYLYTC